MKIQLTATSQIDGYKRSFLREGKLACHIDLDASIVRISILDQDDKAFGYVEYSFDEMPIATGTRKS